MSAKLGSVRTTAMCQTKTQHNSPNQRENPLGSLSRRIFFGGAGVVMSCRGWNRFPSGAAPPEASALCAAEGLIVQFDGHWDQPAELVGEGRGRRDGA